MTLPRKWSHDFRFTCVLKSLDLIVLYKADNFFKTTKNFKNLSFHFFFHLEYCNFIKNRNIEGESTLQCSFDNGTKLLKSLSLVAEIYSEFIQLRQFIALSKFYLIIDCRSRMSGPGEDFRLLLSWMGSIQ